jgi:hypothetical protein
MKAFIYQKDNWPEFMLPENKYARFSESKNASKMENRDA